MRRYPLHPSAREAIASASAHGALSFRILGQAGERRMVVVGSLSTDPVLLPEQGGVTVDEIVLAVMRAARAHEVISPELAELRRVDAATAVALGRAMGGESRQPVVVSYSTADRVVLELDDGDACIDFSVSREEWNRIRNGAPSALGPSREPGA